jgi:hypothetical protein
MLAAEVSAQMRLMCFDMMSPPQITHEGREIM